MRTNSGKTSAAAASDTAKRQRERREFLLRYLLEENAQYRSIVIPASDAEQRRLLRALLNVRLPGRASEEFLRIQNAYLTQAARDRGIVRLSDLTPTHTGLYLWQGDITRLACDAIVNAANSGMTGCYVPNHACIDNCIHTFAGIQLRIACAELMRAQGQEEPAGQAKLTPGYNLPARYVLHTVGPIVQGSVTPEDEALLSSCYRSCLESAEREGLNSIAFCCISTGIFHFPNRRAAQIAVETATRYLSERHSEIKVIFNVFKDEDDAIYQELLR